MTDLRFDNAFVRELPADPETSNTPRQVAGVAFSWVEPTPVPAPRTIAVSGEVAGMLGIDPDAPDFAAVFAGNARWPGMTGYAMAYGGHQFGHWAGQLGDGRAIGLGEILTDRHGRQEVQLKGAGRTPYSRGADGRAVLRSSIREFLCSEAMHHLGVPTTRALSLVATGESVLRDVMYDGHPAPEPGAIVCRVAPSFLRFGTYELPSSRGDVDLLRRLVDFTVATHYPQFAALPPVDGYAAFFAEVCERTAVLMAQWMRVGFVHGVMNTDNMSILGLTIDYGPYGWIDDFDPDWTPNTTDRMHRRYRFGQQPQVGYWNLQRLAQALSPLFDGVEPLQAGLDRYVETFEATDAAFSAAKLGLLGSQGGDESLVADLRGLLLAGGMDMTIFFRDLALLDLADPRTGTVGAAFYEEAGRLAVEEPLQAWLRRYAERVRAEGAPAEERLALMHASNPRYVLRNYLAQQAIDRAEQGDEAGIHELLDTLRRPYDEQPGRDHLAGRRPAWARERVGCSMLSCSS
ncbi:protein adenylyltransferase SelO [Luteibacter yeojuensis]|uniref:Protein nucleotidyltransferase YdiU n=1 Tax=Luteibacter yeojuensis TaxID=345309 RepID=A0A7X5QT26_9GAMM|nr:YdiU family protein [Luteibacter yeojuensis]NID14902.1 YdiU family protein [Luteibacter yeojuensis]